MKSTIQIGEMFVSNELLQCRIGGCGKRRWGMNEECRDHAMLKFAKRRTRALRAVATRRANHPDWGRPAHARDFWQSRACGMVASAITRGVLPKLDGSIACTDCGAPACEYDHRDYSRPLDVQPVCRSCNKRRGTAKWPIAGQFDFPKISEQKEKGA